MLSTFGHGAHLPRETCRELVSDARCMVASVPGHPDELMGYAIVEPGGAVVWCHTRRVLWRAKDRETGLVLPATATAGGLCTALLAALGVDLHESTPCRYWSPMAAAIARRGRCRIYYEPRIERTAA